MILPVIKMRNIFFLFVLMVGAGQGQNLLDNPSFEGDLRGIWENNGFLMERVSGDTVDGNFALKASFRNRDVEGPIQVLRSLKPNGRYEISLYVKLLNDIKGSLWQKIRVSMQFLFVDTENIETYAIAFRALCDSSMGWIHVNGSMNAPLRAFHWVRLAIRGPDPGVNFLVDNTALYEVPENTNWLADSHAMIDKYRKSNVYISFTTPSDVSPSAFDVQIRLKKHLFPFGVKVKDTQISAKSTDEYTNLIVNMFNWATVQSYKWKFDKGDRYCPDFNNAVSATNILVANGLKVRAHNLLWDVPDNIPDWVLALSGQELSDELDKHVQYMCTLALDKVAHWDVMNEHTHGLYYEEKLQDRNFTKNLFRQMRKCDRSTKLYFNDYQAVDIGGSTQEYYHLMKEYMAQNVPVDGLGVQGHVQTDTTPDPTMIWRRLDRLGMLGLDIFMSEFDVEWPDHVQRADWIEDAMRAMFSHPAMKGIVYWSFWDQDTQNANRELIQGTSLTIIEPGQRFFCLLKKEWTTNITKNLGDGLNFAMRGFHGDYEVIVRRSGVPIQVERFSLGSSDLTVNIQVPDTTTEVNVVEDKDYVPRCVSHRGQTSLGLQSTSSTNMQLTCVNVESAPSGGNEDDVASVTCGTDRVMTGCTSYQNGMLGRRKGEQIVLENGLAVCKAHNGRNSPAGVTATARCCMVSGLTCDYRVAGPSLTFDGAQAEATCDVKTLPFGCSSYSRYPDMDGVYADDSSNSCVAQSGHPSSTSPSERADSFRRLIRHVGIKKTRIDRDSRVYVTKTLGSRRFVTVPEANSDLPWRLQPFFLNSRFVYVCGLEGSVAYAACCSAPGLSCTRVSSLLTTPRTGEYQGVTCPSGYVMVSCTSFAPDGRSGGSRIVDISGAEECRAFLGDNLPSGSRGVMATAACCK